MITKKVWNRTKKLGGVLLSELEKKKKKALMEKWLKDRANCGTKRWKNIADCTPEG